MNLSKKNHLGLYEIRLESIGGLGANLAGKILAEAGILSMDLNGTHFSSYGSEKKGSPVKSFIRFSESNKEIRVHSPIEEPHIIGVFHETLYKTLNVVKGLQKDGIVLVNSNRDFDEVRYDLQLEEGTLAIVDALGISIEEKTKINTVMLGALCKLIDFLDVKVLENVIRKTFENKYEHLVESNIRSFYRGYNEVIFKSYIVDGNLGYKEPTYKLKNLGYKTQVIGGTIDVKSNSEEKNMNGYRQGFIPDFDMDKCINCAKCHLVCPDSCFVWEETEGKKGRLEMVLKGIDYQYCKGCLKCVESCPVEALTELREEKGYASTNSYSKHKHKNKNNL